MKVEPLFYMMMVLLTIQVDQLLTLEFDQTDEYKRFINNGGSYKSISNNKHNYRDPTAIISHCCFRYTNATASDRVRNLC